MEEKNAYTLIIIGGGPAGVSAGIYSARKRIKTLLITKDFLGQPGKTADICNYPGFPQIKGLEFSQKLKEQLFGLSNKQDKGSVLFVREGEEVVELKKENSLFLVKTKNGEYRAKFVIAASGSKPRTLGVPGEKEFVGRGVSYCSICDGPFFADKSVVVAGGGNSGLEAAIDLEKYAQKIFLFERNSSLAGDEILAGKVKTSPKIEIFLNKELIEIKGSGGVEEVVYTDIKSGQDEKLSASGIFVAIGGEPASGYLAGVAELNDKGEVKVDPASYKAKASQKNLYAVGDVNDTIWKQITCAVGEGSVAALEVDKNQRKEF